MQPATERNIFLSTLPATKRDRNLALAVVGVSAVLFALVVPYAGTPLPQVPAFVVSYQSALAVNDLITQLSTININFQIAIKDLVSQLVILNGRFQAFIKDTAKK